MKKLFKLGIFAALVAGVAKFVSGQMAEFKGLTEPEVRAKLHTKLDDKIGAEKVDEMGDGIVKMMRDKGALGEEAPSEA